MERDRSQNRKRTRDNRGDENEESNKGKKPDKRYEFCDGIGVFDFPWLKESVIFKVDEYLEPEEKFAACSYLDGIFTANLDQQDSYVNVSPALDGNLYDNKLDGESFGSLRVDNIEPVDCIWSCVIEQPLDIGLNKV
ncbi:hypothetical protein CDL12_13282 [Handroanthus impetiginosus]|uniref:Uncharacterized protein n=1 Tax=Handroanthus impetiginosus TaxID=429701 RepID=A0A2G9H985_9LAMI|nr:hypothetical protein CDL12_13282 [Handroanthus impetiginosus]